MRYSELRREAERLEGGAYSLRKTIADLDAVAWAIAARACGDLEALADRLRELEKIEREATP